MQVVIDIDEKTYDDFMYLWVKDSDILRAVRNGTPLPKGHGRLIDADSIHQIVRPIEQSDAEWGMTAETAKQIIHDAFNKAPTIIEGEN